MVVIDMEMPKCCADCVFFVQLAGSEVTECVMPEGREGQRCPLTDVQQRQGGCDNCKYKELAVLVCLEKELSKEK